MKEKKVTNHHRAATVCPACSNTLTVSRVPDSVPDNSPDASLRGKNRFECRSCPYQYVLDRRYYERKAMKRKEVEDVLGGKDAWENVDQTDVQCPNQGCGGDRAYFYQIQIRSADEPMTSFFKCTKCAKQWRE
ncbi:putative DNA-directed RNA polymerase III [Neofusicoccum parvum]|uniref:DNA-directed RNA polymerase III n=1 Tax=Neofusicoccum parvum TaxID=310453 RepID=A0ACB5RU20_9PEZI|nr:putative DNA-directed RNA polymerase III [Neofusicoccum parvum]